MILLVLDVLFLIFPENQAKIILYILDFAKDMSNTVAMKNESQTNISRITYMQSGTLHSQYAESESATWKHVESVDTAWKHAGFEGAAQKHVESLGSYLKVDLHTHTIASGHATTDRVTDLAKEAAARGMEILGISDHGPATPGSASLSYFRNLFLCERKRFGIELRYGVEANILDKDGTLDVPDEILETLDYCIISMHRPIYTSGSALENTRAYIRAMRHPKVKIIGHCDDSRFPVDYRELVEAALSCNVLPELNNVSLLPDSYRKDCHANAAKLLQSCEALSCPILLSSDSHGKQHIGEADEAWKLIREVDFPANLIQAGVSSG